METMRRIDNDATKGLAVPFLILAHVRTGGTFLAHALSNHPKVYCDRGETLHHLSAWRSAGVPVDKILATIWKQDGYHASGFRAIYRQAFHAAVWPLIESTRPRVIHLTRRNLARQGVSFGYQQLVRQGKLPFHPVHSFDERMPAPVAVDTAEIVGYAVKVRREMAKGRARLAGYKGPVLEVAYEDLAGGGAAPTRARVQEFLGVEREPLRCDLARDFPAPMSEWFTNWKAIRTGLEAAGFGGLDG
jgi:hypothetical protein